MQLLPLDVWVRLKDGDRDAFQLFKGHYSYRVYADGRRDDPTNRNRRLFCGPGDKMVLLTPDAKALFVWRKFIDDSGQQGVNNAIFRNTGPQLSSVLILEAEKHAWERWPGERLYTYVDAAKTAKRRGKHNLPGHCYRIAGWRECGETKSGKLILEKTP